MPLVFFKEDILSTKNNKISNCQRNANDEFDFQILQLTPQFYEAFPKHLYPEILNKHTRSYNCLLIQSHSNFFICIPYRSEITHNYAFKFKKSHRSKKHKSGLDYISHIQKEKLLSLEEFNRRYRFSPLKYFHKELFPPV